MTQSSLPLNPDGDGRVPRAPPYPRIGIIGAGLIGGSLAKALRRIWPEIWIQASMQEEADRRVAVDDGILDAAFEKSLDACAAVELIVLAAPLTASLRLMPLVAEAAPDAVITDVGSLKGPVLAEAVRIEIAHRFVGGHPMAGSERSGWTAGHDSLYLDRPVYLVEQGASPEVRAGVAALWSAIGAKPRWVTAADHDRKMIWSSHLPQVVSTALAVVLEAAGVAREELGPGGTDMTRLAGSSPTLWRDLFENAPDGAGDPIRSLAETLNRLAEVIDSGDTALIEDMMTAARRWKEACES